jgi:hypothetical protein
MEDKTSSAGGNQTGGEKAPHDELHERLRKKVPRVASNLLILSAVTWSLYLLFWPLCPENPEGAKMYPPVKPFELPPADPPLDVYLARDASGSVMDKKRYKALEDAVIHHAGLKLTANDRASYARFGDGTWPPEIQPALGDVAGVEALEANRSSRLPAGFARFTDFAALFNELGAAIKDERRNNPLHAISEHTDLIIVISDGVPDVTAHHRRCPDQFPADDPFITDKIKKSFINLVDHSGSMGGGKIVPYLVLAGGKKDCMPKIKAQWEKALGRHGLRVIGSSSRSKPAALVSPAFEAAGRRPMVFVNPSYDRLEDDQIDLLTKRKDFSARYAFWSFLRGDTATIRVAALYDDKGRQLARFHVEEAGGALHDNDPRAEIKVEGPGQDRVRGDAETRLLHFQQLDTIPRSTRLESCKIQLITDNRVSPGKPLLVGRSATKEKTRGLLGRTLLVAQLGLLPIIFRVLLYGAFALLPKGEKWSKRRERLLKVIKRTTEYVIDPMVVALLGVLTLSWMVIVHPISFILAPVFGALVVLWLSQRKIVENHRLGVELLVVGVEFLAFFIARGV